MKNLILTLVLFFSILALPIASLRNVLAYGDEIEILKTFEEIEAGIDIGLYEWDLSRLIQRAQAEIQTYLKSGAGEGKEKFILCISKMLNAYIVQLDKLRKGEGGAEINVNSGGTYLSECWHLYLDQHKQYELLPMQLKPID